MMLLLAHRKSFDFDVFLEIPINQNLLVRLKSFFNTRLLQIVVDSADELSVIVSPNIKISFVFFPFPAPHKLVPTSYLPLFSLPDLASNKAYVISRRGVWRDYVDLFWALKSGLKFEKIVADCKKRFGSVFSEKLLLEQLTYFGDITDFTVEYISRQYKPSDIQKYFQGLVKTYVKKGRP